MKISYTNGLRVLGVAIATGLLGAACSSDDKNNSGGTASSTGGATSATGGKASTGGATSATGGKASTGGQLSTGGTTTGVGGTTAAATSTGGTTSDTTEATGGVATGGTSSTTACGTDTSTYSETATFTDSSAAPSWELNTTSSQTGATFSFTTTSPAGSTICDSGCGVLSFTIPAGTGWGGSTIVNRWFASPLNLLGNTVKAQVALEVDPSAASAAVVQVFTQGGSASNYAWGANISGPSAVTDTTSWHEVTLNVADTGSFCASSTGAVGLIVQRQADSTTDITGKLYIKSVVIGSNPSMGTGGASSIGTSTESGGTTSTTAGGASSSGGVTSTGTSSESGGTTSTTAGGASSTGGATSAPSSIACSGCLDLYVPLAAEKTGTDFEVDLGASTVIDLSATTVTAHVYVVTAGNAGGIRLYAKNDTTYVSAYSTWEDLTAKTGWQDITLDVSTDTSTFDKTKVRWIGFNIAAGDTFTGANFGATTVYVDSVTFSSAVASNYTFDSAAQGWAINTYNSPVTGSTITWVNQ